MTPDTILTHVREQKAAGIANATVNRELDIIRGVLKKAKRWHLFADEIRPLPVRQNIGRALSYDEKLRLLKLASSRPEWQNAAWATSLALNTTMRGCGIKQLKWRDMDLMERTLSIRKSKTEAGERVIPLNADSWNAVLSLYRRAQALGDVLPEHYMYSMRVKPLASTQRGLWQVGERHGAIFGTQLDSQTFDFTICATTRSQSLPSLRPATAQ